MLRAVSIAAVFLGLGLICWQIIGSMNGNAPIKLDKIGFLNPPPTPKAAPAPAFKASSMSDSLAARRLDLPMPQTVSEILNSPHTYKRPEMPGRPGELDEEMNAHYRGWYEVEPGKFLKLELNNTSPRTVRIEGTGGTIGEFNAAKADFEVYNFNQDPYTLILELDPSKKLFVKFHSGGVRAMNGWLIDWGKPKKLSLLSLKDQSWPTQQECARVLPPDL